MILHFDNASKRNLWMAGGGEVLQDSKERRVVKYSRGLGSITSNQFEAYALLKGIELDKENQIVSLIMLRDFLLIIQH